MVSLSNLPRMYQRNGVYYFRVKLPDDIKSHFSGRKEIKRSLLTCNLTEALKRYATINSRTESLFGSIRHFLITGVNMSITESQIAQLVDQYMEESLRVIREEKAEKGHIETLPIYDELERIDEKLHEADYSKIIRDAKLVLEKAGIEVTSETDMKILCRQLLLAQKDILKAYLEPEHIMKPSPLPLDYSPDIESLSKPTSKRLSEAVKLKLQQMEADKLTKKTLQEAEGKLSVWQKILGDKDIASYTYEDMLSAQKTLGKLPKTMTTSARLKVMSVKELMLEAEVKGLEVYSERTVSAYSVAISSLFKFCMDRGWIDRNPVPAYKVSKKLKRDTGWKPYELEDIGKLLEITKQFREHRPERYWIPRLALYAGLRAEEACQLHCSDVGESKGVYYISVNDESDDKKVKTDSSIRKVPIHPDILEGFLEYKRQVESCGNKRLWPNLSTGAHGKYSHEFSKWYGRFSRKNITQDDKKVFHSLRKSCAKGLADAGVSREIIGALLGHASDHQITELYTGKHSLEILQAALAKLKF